METTKIDGYKKQCTYCKQDFTSTNLAQLVFNLKVHELTCEQNPVIKMRKEQSK